MPQTALIQGHQFTGPYSVDISFNDVPGIYIIATSGGNIVDVGETGHLGERINCHDRRPCWDRNQGHFLWFHGEANSIARLLKESALRRWANPTCGIR
mgnify:FL=1